MAKIIKVTQLVRVSDTQFTAAGSCDGRPFVAKTIVYRGEPIFKVQEDSEGELKHLTMKDSSFNRGDRIAIARRLKQVRLGEAEVEVDFSQLTVKELRARAQELGVKGWRDGSVRKAQLAALVQQAAS
jgi:hypothetical protein